MRMRPFGTVALVSALSVVVMFGVARPPTLSAQQTGGLPALAQRVAVLEALLSASQQNVAALEAALAAETAARQAADAALATRATLLEDKTQFMSVAGTDVIFTGANVHIRNGLGATNGNPADPRTTSAASTVVNGLGNLIIGYNELGGIADFPRDRTGSHYLVIGDYNYYSGFGGIAAGRDNNVRAAYASTLGGRSNRVPAAFAAIVGGAFNLADGHTASILGGNANRASELDATVAGGSGNSATARFSSVGGGAGIIQATEFGWSAGSFGPVVAGAPRSP